VQENIALELRTDILPLLLRMSTTQGNRKKSDFSCSSFLLRNLTTDFQRQLIRYQYFLSPLESKICNLTRLGHDVKDRQYLGLSPHTVQSYRGTHPSQAEAHPLGVNFRDVSRGCPLQVGRRTCNGSWKAEERWAINTEGTGLPAPAGTPRRMVTGAPDSSLLMENSSGSCTARRTWDWARQLPVSRPRCRACPGGSGSRRRARPPAQGDVAPRIVLDSARVTQLLLAPARGDRVLRIRSCACATTSPRPSCEALRRST